jgi:heterodisulfide reductase subunit C
MPQKEVLRMPMGGRGDGLVEKIIALSGQNLHLCFQCAKCSSGCPSVLAMEHAPNQIVRLLLLMPAAVVDSDTVWRCSSCYTCVSRCPKGIDIAKIAEAVRALRLRKKIDRIELCSVDDAVLRGPQQLMVAAARKYTG